MFKSEDTESKWTKFLEGRRVIPYEKGRILFFEGEVPRSGYIIKTGLVKVYDLSDSGYEQVIYINTPKDIFPLPWLAAQRATAVHYHEALTSCMLYSFTKEEYLDFIKNDPQLLLNELQRSADKEANLSMHLSAALNSKASDKLINTLYYLVKCYGVSVDEYKIRIDLKLTQQDIADLTGLRRETITVEINKLKDTGVINNKDRSFYQINIKLLNKLLSNRFNPND